MLEFYEEGPPHAVCLLKKADSCGSSGPGWAARGPQTRLPFGGVERLMRVLRSGQAAGASSCPLSLPKARLQARDWEALG